MGKRWEQSRFQVLSHMIEPLFPEMCLIFVRWNTVYNVHSYYMIVSYKALNKNFFIPSNYYQNNTNNSIVFTSKKIKDTVKLFIYYFIYLIWISMPCFTLWLHLWSSYLLQTVRHSREQLGVANSPQLQIDGLSEENHIKDPGHPHWVTNVLPGDSATHFSPHAGYFDKRLKWSVNEVCNSMV